MNQAEKKTAMSNPTADKSDISKMSRLAFLDNIRILLTALVVMHHSAITYGADGGWYRHEVDNASLATSGKVIYAIFTATNQAFFMGFFFLIAGYLTPMSLSRKSIGQFIRDRFMRLGIPLAVFALVISPITIGIARLGEQGGTIFDGFYWVYAMGHYECGPMWFAQVLLIFSLIYVFWAAMGWIDDAFGEVPALPHHWMLFLAALGTGLLAFALRLAMPVGHNFLGMQIGYLASYIVLYFTGCVASQGRWLEKIRFRYAAPWVVVAIVSIAILPIIMWSAGKGGNFAGGWNAMALCYAMWEPFVAWGMILGLLWFFHKYLNRAGRFAAYMAKSTFAVYIVHAPVLVAVSMIARGWIAQPLCKWPVVGLLSCAASCAIAAVLVKLPGFRKVL